MRSGVVAGWVAIVWMAWVSSAVAAPRVEVILDVSGSMAGQVEGGRKIDAARTAVSETLRALPGDAQVGLRLYGHRVAREERERSCRDTELVIPFGPLDRSRLERALADAKPRGQTPLAHSIRSAARDFGADEPAVVILVSDGLETCGDDPVAAAQALLDQGIQLVVHSVGFDVDAEARSQLEGISRITGGEYREARDAAELADSISGLTTRALLREDPGSDRARVRGGTDYESAVPLAAGRAYQLDHHQRRGEYDFFKVSVQGGQELAVRIQTSSRGVRIRGSQIEESGSRVAGLELHRGAGEILGKIKSIGDRDTSSGTLFFPDGSGGTIYILVGAGDDDQHMDSVFHVELRDRFDAGSRSDAGDTDASALALDPGVYPQSYLLEGDTEDRFRLATEPGDTVRFKVRPESGKVSVVATDPDGIELLQASSPNEGAAARGDFQTTEDGPGAIFLSVRSRAREGVGTYSLEVERVRQPRPAAAEPAASELPTDREVRLPEVAAELAATRSAEDREPDAPTAEPSDASAPQRSPAGGASVEFCLLWRAFHENGALADDALSARDHFERSARMYAALQPVSPPQLETPVQQSRRALEQLLDRASDEGAVLREVIRLSEDREYASAQVRISAHVEAHCTPAKPARDEL